MGKDGFENQFEINKFTEHLAKCDRIPAATTYRSILRTFSAWLKTIKKDFDTFTADEVEQYTSTLPNTNTANMFLTAIKSYINYRVRNILPSDPRYLVEIHRRDQLKGLRNRPRRAKREKVALDPEELKLLLTQIRALPNTKTNTLLYSGCLVHFYLGARPVELGYWLQEKGVKYPAKIDWKNNTMELWTAKAKFYRHLSWNDKLTPHLKLWCGAIRAPTAFSDPEEWMTRHLKKFNINGVRVISKTARKTLQTQMRLEGVKDVLIDSILGHVSTTSSIGDTYTDFSKFNVQIDDLMKNQHYMIREGVL